jgi:cellulose synthase/poly-beta-1,6-N-acetylglucosamine synthase-like glycosyltransferase
MTPFFQKVFTRYPVKTRRFFEILPGFLTWTTITSPLWGSILFPAVLAYAILFFDVYYFFKSFQLTVTAYRASRKIKKAEADDWLGKFVGLNHSKKVVHIIIIPNYKEKVEKLQRTLKTLAEQTFPLKNIYVVLAMEEREEEAKDKTNELIKDYNSLFGGVIATYHPDVLGEVKGKSSNEAYAAREINKMLFDTGKVDIRFATVTTADADAVFDKQFCSYLGYLFLSDEKRYNKFWQSAIVFYNNIWQVPAPIRVISFFGSLWRIALLIQGDRLLTHSTYTLSFQLLKEIDFWDADVIPEDYRIFFKAFYRKQGNIWVEPIFLKTSMDAALSAGYINSLKNKYNQERRWSWGVSDNPLFIKWWFTTPKIPFFRKTILLFNVFTDHLLWPINWFIITIFANIMPILNPIYSRTNLGYKLPRLAGFILTSTLIALVIMIYIDYRNRPANKDLPRYKKVLFPLEFILMPVVGFFLSALPALISHTQLMLGKRLEYKVTDKV